MKYDEIRVKEGCCLRIKRFLFVKLKDKNFLKGISTVIGAAFINLIAGAIFGVCQLILYEISYIKHEKPESTITLDNEIFYYPTVKIFQHISSFLSGIIYKKIGLHYTNLIGIIFLFTGYLTLLLSKSFTADIVSVAFAGIGTGIIYYPSTANACEWFMEHNGVVIGIIETSISLGSFFINLLGEQLMESVINHKKDEDKFYTLEEGKKFKEFMIYLIIIVVVLYILSFLLSFKKVNDKFTDKKSLQVGLLQLEENDDVVNNSNSDEQNEKFDEKQLELIANNVDFDKKENYSFKAKIFAAIKSKELIIFGLIVILEGPLSSTIFALYMSIGTKFNIKRTILSAIGPINFLFECIGGFVLGILCDYVAKKYLLLFILGFEAIIGYFYCLTFDNSVMFFIFTNIASFTSGGFYSVKDYYLIRIFGVEIYVVLIAIINFCSSIIILGLSPLSYSLQNKNEEITKTPYWIMFAIFGTCSIIGFAISFLIKDNPFDYDKVLGDDNENDKKQNKTEDEKI